MLATMRPTQIQPPTQAGHHSRNMSRNPSNNNSATNSAAPSRPSSAKLSRSNSNRSNASNAEKHVNVASVAKGHPRSSKKGPSSALVNEVQPVQQNVPGLITLSKPLEEGNDKKGRVTEDGSKSNKAQRKKKVAGLINEDRHVDANLLSSSAPAAANGKGNSEWSMPAHRANEDEALTWQQQLINATPTVVTPEKKKAAKKTGNKKALSNTASPSPAKDSLTWQQELLGSNKPRGPTFDVFADARDEATFGGGSGSERPTIEGQGGKMNKKKQQGGGGRRRADSAGESRLRLQGVTTAKNKKIPQGLPSAPLGDFHQWGSFANANNSPTPSTPDGKIAYAGPNFHNSPSAAALPVPKFLQQKAGAASSSSISSGETLKPPSSPFARDAIIRNAVKESGSGVSNDGDISTSSEEDNDGSNELKRSTRGATAPPELQQASGTGSNDQRSMTIQNLMAKLMMPASD